MLPKNQPITQKEKWLKMIFMQKQFQSVHFTKRLNKFGTNLKKPQKINVMIKKGTIRLFLIAGMVAFLSQAFMGCTSQPDEKFIGLQLYSVRQAMNEDAKGTDPVGDYKSGNLLAKKVFGENPRYDNNWYTFGPFNPTEGDLHEDYGGYVFKVICEGVMGDDGNMYQYFVSTSQTENKRIEGGNAFAYEYSFRMHNDPNEVSHIYPYVDNATIKVVQKNFDWDSDGVIRVVSVGRAGLPCRVSGDDGWMESEFVILDEEKNTSLDFQFIKRKNPPVKNNNVVISVENQYGELLPFYTVPIGGVPKYKYSIGVKKKSN